MQLNDAYLNSLDDNETSALRSKLKRLNDEEAHAHANWYTVAAHAFSIPKTATLAELVHFFDLQLLRDVQTVYDEVAMPSGSTRVNTNRGRGNLRPFYKVMVEAYEAEFLKDNGLKDVRLAEFFDKYVHNSLAGFGADATMPSDPRVVYVGKDTKGRYANMFVEPDEQYV